MTAPETNLSATPSVESDAEVKLRELTNQSWNLELVISGAALFGTLGLADSLDQALMYYRYNLMPDESGFHDPLSPFTYATFLHILRYALMARFTLYVLFVTVANVPAWRDRPHVAPLHSSGTVQSYYQISFWYAPEQ